MVFRPSEIYSLLPEPLLYEDDPENGILKSDPDYEYQSDSDCELLEYDSDANDDEHLQDEDVILTEKESADQPKWIFKVSGPDHPEYDTEFLPLSTSLGESLFYPIGSGAVRTNEGARHKARCYEHIGGPGCQNRQAYLGAHISVEEMRGCHTVQCIVPKKEGWESRSDDVEFERDSQYVLTGVADRMPSSGSRLKFAPVRYGVDNIEAETNFVLETVCPSSPRIEFTLMVCKQSQEELRNIGLPFHPTCFEIFIQATRKFLNFVDVDTLVQIRDTSCLAAKKFPVRHHQHVLDGLDQWWNHRVGHEYLAANPIFIPALKPILESAASNDKNFSVQNSPFEKRHRTTALSPAQDPFLAFPLEIILGIVDHLNSPDIATLRLSSHAFTHLPIALWHRLIVKEMPWLYEAWSSDPKPYHWATVIAQDLHEEKKRLEEFNRDIEERREVIQRNMPEVYDEWVKNEPKWEWPEHPERRDVLDLSPVKLAYETTNWHRLHHDITGHWNQLKGLQNRARIWDAVMQIIDAMRETREKLRVEGDVRVVIEGA